MTIKNWYRFVVLALLLLAAVAWCGWQYWSLASRIPHGWWVVPLGIGAVAVLLTDPKPASHDPRCRDRQTLDSDRK